MNPFKRTGFIFQTNRHLLFQQVTKYGDAVSGRTLDVGCGPTPRYLHLFKNVTEYLKMDVFEGENIDVVGFAEDIPFSDQSFDSIVCTETLHDVFEPVKAGVEFARVLKKGGVLLLTVPCIGKQSDSLTDNWRFTRHSLKRLLEESGFTIEVMEQRGAYWSAITQLCVGYWILKLHVYDAWYERIFGIFASVIGKFSIWLDSFEKGETKSSFTNGYIVIARKI